MKVLLALSLLFFLDSVFSQEYVNCNLLEKCPDGYTPQYFGRTQQVAECKCKKNPPEVSLCSSGLSTCRPYLEQDCTFLESYCSPEQIIDFCNKGTYSFPVLCDRANQKLMKGKYATTQGACKSSTNQCNMRISYHCNNAAATCDPDTIIQLCKNKRITDNYICEAAEIQKEKDRAEDTKYTCNYLKRNCIDHDPTGYCSEIVKYCDVETGVKRCFKNETREMLKISDKDCTNVIKKSQYLMFGKANEECWNQLPLCEGGNSEACMQVATLCGKEIVSALCNAKKITNKRICTFAGLEEATSSSYPGCKFFEKKCDNREDEYCELASRYCDDKTIADLCNDFSITDRSACKRVSAGIFAYTSQP